MGEFVVLNKDDYKVEFADKEYQIRQTGEELPDYLKCRIVESNGDFEIRIDIKEILA